MKYQITKLLKEVTKEIQVNEEVDFAEVVKKNPDLRKMSPVLVTGKGTIFPTTRCITFDLKIQGEMTLPCALTLDDVIFAFEAQLNPTFTWDADRYDPDSDDYLVKDTIELASSVWQEIFVQIPLRVVKEGAYDELAAQGIAFVSEEDYEKAVAEKVDPRFEILKNLKLD